MREGFYKDEVDDTRYISQGVACWFTYRSGAGRIEVLLDNPVKTSCAPPQRHTYYLPEEYLT